MRIFLALAILFSAAARAHDYPTFEFRVDGDTIVVASWAPRGWQCGFGHYVKGAELREIEVRRGHFFTHEVKGRSALHLVVASCQNGSSNYIAGWWYPKALGKLGMSRWTDDEMREFVQWKEELEKPKPSL